jgi:opacity protein-like surface antigen
MRVGFLALCLYSSLCSISFAADVVDGQPPMPPASDFYGQAYMTVQGVFTRESNDTQLEPFVTLGGQLGYETMDSPWGIQVDSEVIVSNNDWIRPTVTDVEGDLTVSDNSLHVTYRPSDMTKLGAFAGFSHVNVNIEDETGGTLSLLDIPGLRDAHVTESTAAVGVEGMIGFTPARWLEGRIALLDPLHTSFDANVGPFHVTDKDWDFLGDSYGVAVSSGIMQALSPQAAVGAQGMLTVMDEGNHNSTEFLGIVAASYRLEQMPVALSMIAGGKLIWEEGATQEELILASRITMPFGQPTPTSQGKLFRPGIVDF